MDFIKILACHKSEGMCAVLQLCGNICCLFFESFSLYSSRNQILYTSGPHSNAEFCSLWLHLHWGFSSESKVQMWIKSPDHFYLLHYGSYSEAVLEWAHWIPFWLNLTERCIPGSPPNTMKLLKGIQSWKQSKINPEYLPQDRCIVQMLILSTSCIGYRSVVAAPHC